MIQDAPHRKDRTLVYISLAILSTMDLSRAALEESDTKLSLSDANTFASFSGRFWPCPLRGAVDLLCLVTLGQPFVLAFFGIAIVVRIRLHSEWDDLDKNY